MCEQCQAFDDEDDLDRLAAAFLARGKALPAGKPAPPEHALLNRQAPPVVVAAAKKVAS